MGLVLAARPKINVDLTPFKSNEHALGFDVGDDFGQAGLGFEVGHDEGFEAFGGGAHAGGVGMHHIEVGADVGGEVGFVDDEEVALGDARAAFAGDFFAGGDVNDVDGEVGEFGAESGGEVVPAAFNEHHVGIGKFFKHAVDGFQVDGSVFANGGVRTATCFNAHDAIGIERAAEGQQALIFFGVDVVGDGHQVPFLAHAFAEHFQEGGFARADGAADAHTKGRQFFGSVGDVVQSGHDLNSLEYCVSCLADITASMGQKAWRSSSLNAMACCTASGISWASRARIFWPDT